MNPNNIPPAYDQAVGYPSPYTPGYPSTIQAPPAQPQMMMNVPPPQGYVIQQQPYQTTAATVTVIHKQHVKWGEQ